MTGSQSTLLPVGVFRIPLLCYNALAMNSDADEKDWLSFLVTTVEHIRDQMATKEDLLNLENRMTLNLGVQIAAVRGDLERVNLRLDSIIATSSRSRAASQLSERYVNIS